MTAMWDANRASPHWELHCDCNSVKLLPMDKAQVGVDGTRDLGVNKPGSDVQLLLCLTGFLTKS